MTQDDGGAGAFVAARAEYEEKSKGDKEPRRFETAVTAPYAFVPIDPFVLASVWGEEGPSHDRPLADGVTGLIEVRWTAETPLLVGGRQVKRDGETVSTFAVSRDRDGVEDIALPGSTLRGLLRNVLEIATASRLVHTDRRAHYAVRDTTDPYWQRYANAAANREIQVNAAWLERTEPGDRPSRDDDASGWGLRLCRKMEIQTQDVLEARNVAETRKQFEARTVAQKYQLLAQHGGAAHRMRVPDVGGGASVTGRLVFTGPDPKRNDEFTHKRKSWFFYDLPDEEEPLHPLPDVFMARFIAIHTRVSRGANKAPVGAWHYWFDELTAGRIDRIPVFLVVHREAGATVRRALEDMLKQPRRNPPALFLSLSAFFKVPHRRSPSEILAEAQKDHTGGAVDLVQALFGHVPPDKGPSTGAEKAVDHAWKGRLFFRDARRVDGTPRPDVQSGVTMTPRPSFWPYYLVPKPEARKTDAPFDYSNAASAPAGWKRYPVRRGLASFQQPETAQGAEAAARQRSVMEFVTPADERPLVFQGEIRVHNLHPVEFGALLWAITLGAPDGLGKRATRHRHLVGRGKPQGYGRVRAEVAELTRVERNDGRPPASAEEYVEQFKSWVVKAWNGVQARQVRKESVATFEEIPSVATLLALADPEIGGSVEARLAYPKSGQKKSDEETPSLAGYRIVKMDARQRPRRILPPYPRRPHHP